MKAIVDEADPIDARINAGFLDYAQARGFVVDPARVRRPQDKGLASHCTSYARCAGLSAGCSTGSAVDPGFPGRGRRCGRLHPGPVWRLLIEQIGHRNGLVAFSELLAVVFAGLGSRVSGVVGGGLD
jgi:hypothetical protein